MKDKSNEAFTLFPMCKICKNLWMESLRNFSVLLISFQELKVVYKHQFAETDKMVWFNTEVTSELGLNSYLTRVSKRPERAHCYFSVEWTLELTNNLTEGTNKARDCLSLKRVRALFFFFFSLSWHSPTTTLGSEADLKGKDTLSHRIRSTILRKAVSEHTPTWHIPAKPKQSEETGAQAGRRRKKYYKLKWELH